MRKIEDVLRLHAQGFSTRRMSRATGVGKTTVIEYLRLAAARGVGGSGAGAAAVSASTAPEGPPVHRAGLDAGSPRTEAAGSDARAALERVSRATPGRLRLLRLSREHDRHWAGRLSPVMRRRHVAGERMFADYSGHRVSVIDPTTGAAHPADIFTAVMGASNRTYVEASWTRRLPDWIGAHTRAFAAFGAGGVRQPEVRRHPGLFLRARGQPQLRRDGGA